MLKIEHPSQLHTVIVTVDADAHVLPSLETHAQAGLSLFREFDGFIAGALHKSADGGRLVQYTQWKSRAAYDGCVTDPRWNTLSSTARFLGLVQSGQARMDVRAFDIIGVADGGS